MAKHKKQKVVACSAPVQSGNSALHICFVVLLCAVAFLSPLKAGSIFSVPILAVQTLIFAAALIWTMDGLKQGRLELPGGLVMPAMGLFTLLAIFSAFDSISLHSTVRELANVMGYFLVFLMVASLRDDRKGISFILASLMLSALVVGAIGIKEHRTAEDSIWRVFATFFNPDYLAGFMAIMLPLAAVWFVSRTSLGMSALMMIGGLFVLGTLFLTGSRFGVAAGFLGIIVCLVFAFMSGSMKRQQRAKLLVLLIPGILATAVLAKPLIVRLTTHGAHGVKQQSHSGNFRLYTWHGTIKMAEAYRVNGSGLGTFEVGYPQTAIVGYTKLAHNSYLRIAAESGPLSAVVLLVLLASIVCPCAAALRRKPVDEEEREFDPREFVWEPNSRLLACGLLGGVVASLARNIIDSDWYVPAVGITFWIAMGALVALTYPRQPREVRITPPVYAGIATCLAVGLVVVLVMLSAAVKSDEAQSSIQDQDFGGAVSSYESAIRLTPKDTELHWSLGLLYLGAASHSGDLEMAHRAESELLRVMELQPTSAKTYYQLSKIYEMESENDRAIDMMKTALKCDPQSPLLLLRLANLYEMSGKSEEVLKVYRRMTEIEETPYEQIRAIPEFVDPQYIFAHDALGREAEARGDKETATREYEKAMDRISRYQASLTGMAGRVEEKRDREMEARVERVRESVEKKLGNLR